MGISTATRDGIKRGQSDATFGICNRCPVRRDCHHYCQHVDQDESVWPVTDHPVKFCLLMAGWFGVGSILTMVFLFFT